jgi:non-ribosomal peptide synthetase component F
LEGSRYEDLRASWSRRLARPLPRLALAPDRPRPDAPRHRSGIVEHRLPKKLTDEARVFSREREATLFMTCLAAFQATLHRRSGETDMLLGCLTAGRELGGLEDLVGYFVNVLVLRTDLSGNPTLAELLDRARKSVLETVAGQEFPFLHLLEMLDIDPASNGIPLASVHIQMRNFPEADARAGDLHMKAFPYDHGIGRFDLTFDMVDQAEGLYLPVTHNLDLYDRDTAAGLIEDFEKMLDRLVHAPDSKLSSC